MRAIAASKHLAILGLALGLASPLQAQERASVAPKAMQAVAPALAEYTDRVLYGDIWERSELSPRDRSLVTISALIATGKYAQLGGHITRGLRNGLTSVQIGGLVTQLAFYSGWPNAVSAVGVIEKVYADAGIAPPASDATTMTGSSESDISSLDLAPGVAQAAPKFADLTKRILTDDLWRRTDLSPRDRSLVTITALAANGDIRDLRQQLLRGLQSGLTSQEIGEAVTHMAFYVGWPKSEAALEIAAEVFAGNPAALAEKRPQMDVVTYGVNPVVASGRNFTGPAIVSSRFTAGGSSLQSGATVTFQPGSRTNWHMHPRGQLLIITQGEGLIQSEGQAVRKVKPGDVVWTPPGVRHWHGASPDHSMSHVALAEDGATPNVVWMAPVTEREYQAR